MQRLKQLPMVLALAALGGVGAAQAAGSGSLGVSTVSAVLGSIQTTALGSTVTGSPTTTSVSVAGYQGSEVLTGVSFSLAVAAADAVSLSYGMSGSNRRGDIGVSLGLDLAGTQVSGALGSTVYRSSDAVSLYSPSPISGTIGDAAGLAAFYGQGPVTGSFEAALYGKLVYGTHLQVSASVPLVATLTTQFSTAAHADGGFDLAGSNGLSLSFGQLAAGSVPAALGFELFNRLGSYGLQLLAIEQTQGQGVFSLSGLDGGVANLAAGGKVSGAVSYAGPAHFAQTTDLYGQWRITVADSAVGDAAGRNLVGLETLTLDVSARMLGASPVPEPASGALMLAGLGALAFLSRRARPMR